MSATASAARSNAPSFRHEAVLYAGEPEFVALALPFVAAALAAGDPALVVVAPRKIDLLRAALGADSRRVQFADMTEIGRNPARIIPIWRDFVDANPSAAALRGIGEPIDDTRTADELTECHRHEALLNVAFADDPPLWLRCPYDTRSLDTSVIAGARRNHPFVAAGGGRSRSGAYRAVDHSAFHETPLPEPPADHLVRHFDSVSPLEDVRSLVAEQAMVAGLDRQQTADLVVAVNELATNSIRHGGGRGTLRLWHEPGGLVCEVADAGRISHPLAGRTRPPRDGDGGRGLWLVNQLCDLSQLRSTPGGTVVRVRMRRT